MATERTWRHKAQEIIGRYCLASYKQANTLPNGRTRKRHVPYSVPEIAAALILTLDINDEAEAKRLFEVERIGAWTLI